MNHSIIRDIALRSRATCHAAHLLVIMSMHDSGKPPHCFASTDSLAAQMNACRKTVVNARKKLIELGEIVKVGSKSVRTPSGRQSIPIYRVAVEVIMGNDPRGSVKFTPPQASVKFTPPKGKGVQNLHPKESILFSIPKGIEKDNTRRAGKISTEPSKPIDPDYEAWLEEHS